MDILTPRNTIQIEVVRPIVSIVIPTYNHLDLLKACIESIKTYTDLVCCEVIIVANGCTDGTHDYLKTLPSPFRSIESSEPLGYTVATNVGVKAASGDYIVLLNNDTVLLPQEKNTWIKLLSDPFKDPMAGITGPGKFDWKCGGIRRTAMAFWCVMISRKLFQKIGLLDEVFNPGMGEDGDFSIRAEEAGYKLVAVPENLGAEFGNGIANKNFPIYHKGSGTFGDKDYSDISKRNAQILRDRYGMKDRLEEIYKICCNHPCDLDQLFPTFRTYAEKCEHITEFGVRGVFSTYAFLAARPKRMVSYDIEYEPFAYNIEEAKNEAKKANIDFEFRKEDVLKADIEQTELLFIDTLHNYKQLSAELSRHASKVSKYILIHDTETYGSVGDDKGMGEVPAIDEFLVCHPEWQRKEVLTISNGLTALERKQPGHNLLHKITENVQGQVDITKGHMIKTSIVIPTCGKDWENVLKKCLTAVFEYTDMSDKEVIVVANGCSKEALQYLDNEEHKGTLRLFEHPSPMGYIRAVNVGIREAKGEFVITLDDDSLLQPQSKNHWTDLLMAPFLEDKNMAASGPASAVYEDIGQILHSGCTMYSTAALKKVGLFDEAFNPGYLGDEDLSIRLRKSGFNISEVPKGTKTNYVNGIREGYFPLTHLGNVNTMDKQADLPLIVRNRALLYERHSGLTKTAHGGEPGQGVYHPINRENIRTQTKVSIIIPTFNHLEDLLKPNIDSLRQYTDLSNVEVIVVANGCTDGTEDYVKSLGGPFKVISFLDPLGFTKATNEGIKVAKGKYLVFYNNDNMLLGQKKSQWLDWLIEPFESNPKMGITGPLQLHDDYADADVIIGFCFCISREALNAAGGLLDEVFSPGGGEDIDLCCKVRNAGYIIKQVPKEGKLGFSHTNTGEYPIWHKNNQTFKDIPEYTKYFVKRNGLYNCKRYNKNIKLNLGSGGMEYKGYLSVDLHDSRASIIMDITKLDFEENSVSEMIAIHVLEHLSPYVVLDTLKLWYKILKPGGKLTMELPDLESLCERYLKANTGTRYGITNCIYGSVNTTNEGEKSDITSPHLYGWDKQMIFDHLMNAGFTNIQFMPERYPHPEPPNMSVDAYKPL